MKKLLNYKLQVLIIIILISILVVISFNLKRNHYIIERNLKDITAYVNKIIIKPLTIYNIDKNKDQSKSNLIQEKKNKSLEKEIKELKGLLELNQTLTEYEVVNSTVLNRNKMYWFNTITIDKGKKDGLKKDMSVITKDGLIGKITKVTNTTSEVKLLTSDDIKYKVSVTIKVNEEDVFAILNGYNKNNNTLIVKGVDKNSNINIGDDVLTSGLGGVFKEGIYIGKVKSISSDKYNLSKVLEVESNVDFNNIHYVSVLKDKK